MESSMLVGAPGEASNNASDGVAQPGASQSSWLLTALKVGLSALAFLFLAVTVDLTAVWQRMLGQNPWLVVAAALVIVVQIILGGLRWYCILRRLGAPAEVGRSVQLFYIAAFFNACLWGAVGGDVVRAWLTYRRDTGAGIAVSSVILDRVAAVAGVAMLVLIGAPLFMLRVDNAATALIPAAIAVAGLAAIAVGGHLHRLPFDWQRSRLLRGFHTLSNATRTIFLHPAALVPVLGFAVAAQTATVISAYLLALSLNVPLTFVDCLVLIPPVALITALPISIGGWGVRETAMVGLLSVVGVPPSAALALSVQVGLLSLLASLPGAVFWLRLRSHEPTTDREWLTIVPRR